MTKYIDIILTENGTFCVAPPWVIKKGDMICLTHTITGEPKIHDVVSVATDSVDGEHIAQLERYVGHPLPKVLTKYLKSDVKWEEGQDEDIHE